MRGMPRAWHRDHRAHKVISVWDKANDEINHLVEIRAGNGVEIKMQIVRAVYIVTTRIPLIQVDATKIDHPQK